MLPLIAIRRSILQYSQAIRVILSANNFKTFTTQETESPALFAQRLKQRISEVIDTDFLKSSGPGGQNVNKRNTRVRVKFNIRECTWLSEYAKLRLEEEHGNRINKEGELIVECQEYRTQELNRGKVVKKLRRMIEVANESENNLSQRTIKELKDRKKYLQRKSRSAKKHRLIAEQKEEAKETAKEETTNKITSED